MALLRFRRGDVSGAAAVGGAGGNAGHWRGSIAGIGGVLRAGRIPVSLCRHVLPLVDALAVGWRAAAVR